jgi:lipopolysaccharide/colanic/teichoic acid biosynthesis glycosyltransferase
MTQLLRYNMHMTNAVKNTLLMAQFSSLGEQSAHPYVRASHVSDIMQYGFAAVSLVLLAPLFLTDRDASYTCIGKFLKRTKLDQLPQLVNVLKGEMNFVGPRPVRPIFLEKLCGDIPRCPIRLTVKPGMTGLAQVGDGYFMDLKDTLRDELLYTRTARSCWL